MGRFWRDFFKCRDIGHLISASVAGAAGYLSISLWGIAEHNPLALALNLLGAASADAAYRLMGSEPDGPRAGAIILALASWILPVVAVAIMVFFPAHR